MGSVTYQRESFDDVIAEALPLLQAHWREIARYPDIALDIDFDGYRRLESIDYLRIYTARAPQALTDHASGIVIGRLIGYACFLVGPNLHYRTSVQAKQDVLYVDPAHRGKFVGLRLIRYADRQLAAEGVQLVCHHEKLAHQALGRVLDHAGYEAIETIWAKRLDAAPLPAREAREALTQGV